MAAFSPKMKGGSRTFFQALLGRRDCFTRYVASVLALPKPLEPIIQHGAENIALGADFGETETPSVPRNWSFSAKRVASSDESKNKTAETSHPVSAIRRFNIA